MSKLINVISSIATLTLAAVPLAAVATSAHAAEARVQVGDLDLRTPADLAKFQSRIDVAALSICRQTFNRPGAAQRAECRDAVRQEVVEKLGSDQRRNVEIGVRSDRATQLADAR